MLGIIIIPIVGIIVAFITIKVYAASWKTISKAFRVFVWILMILAIVAIPYGIWKYKQESSILEWGQFWPVIAITALLILVTGIGLATESSRIK